MKHNYQFPQEQIRNKQKENKEKQINKKAKENYKNYKKKQKNPRTTKTRTAMSMVFIALPGQFHAQDCHCALCLGHAKYHLSLKQENKQTNKKQNRKVVLRERKGSLEDSNNKWKLLGSWICSQKFLNSQIITGWMETVHSLAYFPQIQKQQYASLHIQIIHIHFFLFFFYTFDNISEKGV